MYAAAFIGSKIIDLAGWDQGPAGETSNLNVSYNNQFQSVSYIGGSWGRQFFRSGSMATVSFDSIFSFPGFTSTQYQRFVSYFMLTLPYYFYNQQGCEFQIGQPFPTAMGTRQVETATGSGTVTGTGNVAVTLTAAGLDVNPITVNVPVNNGQPSSVWMNNVRSYFASTPQIQMQFIVSGTGSDMVLTRRSPFAGNDPTLNIAIAPAANGSTPAATGITNKPTSTNTTSGESALMMTLIRFYDANVSVSASQLGTSVLLNTSVTGRLEP